MTGTDWRVYELSYADLSLENVMIYMVFWEPGFTLYSLIFSVLGFGFWEFLIITKVITYCLFMNTLKKYCDPQYFFIALMFFVTFYGLFFWIDNPLRNLLGYSIFLLSIPALIEGDKRKYFFINLIAVSFHYSALFLLPLYWLIRKQFKNSSIILLFIIVNILFINPTVLYALINVFLGWLPFVANKLLEYTSGDNPAGLGKIFSFGYILHTVFFMMVLCCRKKICSQKYGYLIFNSVVIYIFCFRIGLTITVLMRIAMYLVLFYSVGIVYVIKGLEFRSKKIYITYFLVVSLMVGYKSLVTDSRYIPYTNYLLYIGKNKPSYEERSNYNNRNSPYPKIAEE